MRLYTMEDGIYINIPNNMVSEIDKDNAYCYTFNYKGHI